jgi:zinc transporter ZupT
MTSPRPETPLPKGILQGNKKSEIHENGWTKKARSLVKLWMGQTALNRRYHHEDSNKLSTLSTRLKVSVAILIGIATFLSFINTTLTDYKTLNIVFSVLAGLFAGAGGVIGTINTILALDSESEKHRQTSIEYAKMSTKAQAVLVEEHEKDLPKASHFLKEMGEMAYLIQLFGPSLNQTNADIADLPSMILMRAAADRNAPKNNLHMDDANIFDRDSDERPILNRKQQHEEHIKNVMQDQKEIKEELENIQRQKDELERLTNQLVNKQYNQHDKPYKTTSIGTGANRSSKPNVVNVNNNVTLDPKHFDVNESTLGDSEEFTDDSSNKSVKNTPVEILDNIADTEDTLTSVVVDNGSNDDVRRATNKDDTVINNTNITTNNTNVDARVTTNTKDDNNQNHQFVSTKSELLSEIEKREKRLIEDVAIFSLKAENMQNDVVKVSSVRLDSTNLQVEPIKVSNLTFDDELSNLRMNSPARTSPVRASPARTSPARTSPARTSPARTSPASLVTSTEVDKPQSPIKKLREYFTKSDERRDEKNQHKNSEKRMQDAQNEKYDALKNVLGEGVFLSEDDE